VVRTSIGFGVGAIALEDVHLQDESIDLELHYVAALQVILKDDLRPVPR
jgi:hypothetical protein